MRRNKFLATVAGVAALGLTLAACDTTTTTPGAGATGASGKPLVTVVSKGFQHQFWQAVKQGADKAAAEFGVDITFEGPDNETNVDQQVQMLRTALTKNPAAIAVAALDSKALAPTLREAQQRNIPVIAFDSGVDNDIPIATAATDNKAAAAKAAEELVKIIGDSGKVGIVAHDQTSTSGKDRRDGFIDYIKANAPGITLLDPQYGGGDQLKSADAAKAILNGNPDIKAIYGTNEGSAIGVVKAVQEGNLQDKVKVVGFDSGKAQLDAIRAGSEAGAVTQNPVGIGYETVKAAAAAIKGQPVEKKIDTGFFWYDAKNIDSAEIKPNLYE